MNIIKPYYRIEDEVNGDEILKKLERASRTCYKSENKINADSAKRLISMIISKGHESCLEHEKLTIRMVTDRGVTHEIVRHRIASYSQESTRYCNYGNAKEITVVLPSVFYDIHEKYSKVEHSLTDSISWRYFYWLSACEKAEDSYLKMIEAGAAPQEARSVLPNSLKTEIVVTMNFRELRHFLRLRTSKAAHPDMRALVIPLFKELKEKIPIIFDDITIEE